MIYYFIIFIKLKYQTKPVVTQRAHILFINKLNNICYKKFLIQFKYILIYQKFIKQKTNYIFSQWVNNGLFDFQILLLYSFYYILFHYI